MQASTMHQDEAAIRALAAAWSRALEAKDLAGMLANYAPDVVLYDLKPPFKVVGIDAYRDVWAACLPYFPDRFASEHHNLEVFVSGDLAFAHGLHRIRPIGEESPAGNTWMRYTIGYQRLGGEWRVVHEHVSVPMNPMTGQACMITDPDHPMETP